MRLVEWNEHGRILCHPKLNRKRFPNVRAGEEINQAIFSDPHEKLSQRLGEVFHHSDGGVVGLLTACSAAVL